MKNPYRGQQLDAGRSAYHRACANCHGQNGEGMGNIPAVARGRTQSASDGELFWYLTTGDAGNGMPSWEALPAPERWEIINYLRVLGSSQPASARVHNFAGEPVAAAVTAPPPKAPFTDFRFEKPGTFRKITLSDLPAPFATTSAGNGPEVVPRPENAWPQVPPGFKVEQYAADLDNPRLIRTAPNGDIFVAESEPGDVHVFRGITPQGKPKQAAIFAAGLDRPFGINFYPPGPNPQWLYVADTDAVVRFPYRNGDLTARGPAEHIADLPHGNGHWTRDIQFTPDGRKMFVSVGSASNVDDPDTHPDEKDRANVLEFNPDGSGMRSLRLRHPELRGDGDQSADERLVVFGERTRRAGRQSGSRLHHPRPGGGLLRLAVVVYGRPPGPPARGQAPRVERPGHYAGCHPSTP